MRNSKLTIDRRIQAVRQWIVNYLSKNPCEGCGITDIRVLTFNHLDRATKKANVSDMVSKGRTLTAVAAEVEKCQVLCHNCHMIATLDHMGNTYKHTMTPTVD